MESGSKKRARIISEPVRYMDKLHESLLIEILVRLPSVRSATQCKLVCPHWNSVISCSHFSARFLKHHPKKEFSMILAAEPFPTLCTYTLFSNDDKFAVSVLESTPRNHTTLDLEILATYNELLLCLHRYHRDSDVSLGEIIMKFHVYNPVTKQHVALPPSPVAPRDTSNVLVGFLCRGQSSFRVVHILRLHELPYLESIRMHIFSSEENKWTEHSLGVLGQKIVSFACDMALPWNGLLCWMSYSNDKLVVCDPYNPEGQYFHFITTPLKARKIVDKFRFGVGVFGGTLRLWHHCEHRSKFRVWELKDYSTKEWSLKHQVIVSMYTHIRAAAFDPNDEDVAYYSTDEGLMSLNMRSGKASLVEAKLKTSFDLPRFEDPLAPWECKYYYPVNLFMLVMTPGFPTPVTTLTESQDQGLETSKSKEA